MIEAYLALGSNLQDPILQVEKAFQEIACLPNTKVLKKSSLYQTSPVGIKEQPDFINAVLSIETLLTADQLLGEMLKIEFKHGRIRSEKNGPRTLDLDLLLYGDFVIQKKHLQVPHPGITTRSFVLVPLAEIAPRLVLPCGQKISDLLGACQDENIEKLHLLGS